MPLPKDWDGIFYGPESQGDLLFDVEPAELHQIILAHPYQSEFALSLMANACFDLLWNKQGDRLRIFMEYVSAQWPDKMWGSIVGILVMAGEMAQFGISDRAIRSMISNTMGKLFCGPVIYPVLP